MDTIFMPFQSLLRNKDILEFLGHTRANLTDEMGQPKVFFYFIIVFVVDIFKLGVVFRAKVAFQMGRNSQVHSECVGVIKPQFAKVTVGMV